VIVVEEERGRRERDGGGRRKGWKKGYSTKGAIKASVHMMGVNEVSAL
jgi:hypothetical protein